MTSSGGKSMSTALQRDNNAKITEYMRRDNWVELEKIFTSAKGQIGNWGGRYAQIEGEPIYLEKICWRIFFHNQASPLKNLSNEKYLAVKNVIVHLRRIYNDTETHRLKNCSPPRFITRFYD